jgi:phosphoribosyl 1,2-cyclic phosphodiesterase
MAEYVNMAKIRFLGTSAGNPHPDRLTSSTLIEGPNGALLLDAGEGCSHRLVQPDHWSQEVRSILVTHRHTDHLAGLPMLLSGYKGTKRTMPLEIHVHRDLMLPLRSWIETLKLGDEHLSCELTWVPLEQGGYSPASGHDGFIWQNDHLPASDMGGCHSLALTLEGERWVFSGDLTNFNSIEPYLDSTRVLVLESRHIEVETAVDRALGRGVEHVVLTHVGHDMNPWPIQGATWAHDNLILDTRSFSGEGD